MKTTGLALLNVFLLLAAGWPGPGGEASPGQPGPSCRFDIFYVAVGSAEYRSAPAGGREEAAVFPNLDGADHSAKRVAGILNQLGAAEGITLVSDINRFVTRADVLSAAEEIARRAAKASSSASKKPLVIFYFCGHGVSEGIGWNHFSVPGDFAGQTKVAGVESLEAALVYAGTVADIFDKQKLPYLLLLDTCYTGEQAQIPSGVISRQLAATLSESFNVLRTLNEFRGPGLAVFSTRPGTMVLMKEDPSNEDVDIGPIARRMALLAGAGQTQPGRLTIGGLLQSLSRASLDPPTATVFTLSRPDRPECALGGAGSRPAAAETRVGTGTPESAPKPQRRDAEASPAEAAFEVLPETYLAYSGEPGEFISQGQRVRLTAKEVEFRTLVDTPDELYITLDRGDTSWGIRFVAPKGRTLAPGVYREATRAGFNRITVPGFEVSGDGRGCNEILAEFRITNVKRDVNGSLLELDAEFTQRCDESAKALQGQLRLRLAAPTRSKAK